MAKEVVNIQDAFKALSKGLEEKKRQDVGSFREFIENIWAHSYDNPQYFKAWHVSLLAEDIEECLAEGLNYVGILPRGHFKSTILGKGIFLIMINGNKDRNPNKNLKNTRL